MKAMVVVLLLAVAAFAVLSLASGSAWLETTLPGGLPLGNVLSALGPCAVAGAALALSAPRSALRAVSVAALVVAVAWLPVSVALAGNLALNFDGWRGTVWFVYTAVVAIAALCVLGWALVASLLAMRGRAAARSGGWSTGTKCVPTSPRRPRDHAWIRMHRLVPPGAAARTPAAAFCPTLVQCPTPPPMPISTPWPPRWPGSTRRARSRPAIWPLRAGWA